MRDGGQRICKDWPGPLAIGGMARASPCQSAVNSKRDDFIAKLTTESGKDVARKRIDRLAHHVAAMQEELSQPASNLENGRLALPRKTTLRRPSGKVWTHPVVADGKLYLRDQDMIFCFDVKEHP